MQRKRGIHNMAEPAVMTEKEKKIMQTFGKVIPKLTEPQKNYLLGLGEGMDIAKSGADRGGTALAAVSSDENESLPW